jgi:hypothetical protein
MRLALGVVLVGAWVHHAAAFAAPPVLRAARAPARPRARAAASLDASVALTTAAAAHGLEPAVAMLQGLGAGFEHELAEYPLRVNALITGVTYLIGDACAQLVEGRDGRPRVLCAKRLARSFATGLIFLGPLSHFYYAWTSASHLELSAQVLLDNTLFLAADNALFLFALFLLGGGGAAAHGGAASAVSAAGREDLGEVLSDALSQIWALQLTGWRFLPLVALVNYACVPARYRVLFVDVADIFYAYALSAQAHRGRAQPEGGDGAAEPPARS